MTRMRSVLTRGERIQKLKDAERWKEGDSPFGLAKVRVYKLEMKKKKKKAKEGRGRRRRRGRSRSGRGRQGNGKGRCAKAPAAKEEVAAAHHGKNVKAVNIDFKLPELGENVHSGDVVNLLVHEGDQIAANDGVFELETDKAVVEIPCPHAGRVSQTARQARRHDQGRPGRAHARQWGRSEGAAACSGGPGAQPLTSCEGSTCVVAASALAGRRSRQTAIGIACPASCCRRATTMRVPYPPDPPCGEWPASKASIWHGRRQRQARPNHDGRCCRGQGRTDLRVRRRQQRRTRRSILRRFRNGRGGPSRCQAAGRSESNSPTATRRTPGARSASRSSPASAARSPSRWPVRPRRSRTSPISTTPT